MLLVLLAGMDNRAVWLHRVHLGEQTEKPTLLPTPVQFAQDGERVLEDHHFSASHRFLQSSPTRGRAAPPWHH